MPARSRSKAPSLAGLPQALSDVGADRRLDVLRRIAVGDSISQAAREVGVSYKAAWQAIETLSQTSGQALVDRTVGGSGGGGAVITEAGMRLLQLADELAQAREAVLSRFSGGAMVAAGLQLRTSMRNQLACQVVALQPLAPDDPTVWVQCETRGGQRLSASVTRESCDLLGLAPGRRVLLLCKATAVVVGPAHRSVRNAAVSESARLNGEVQRIAPGRDRDEVVLGLPGGDQWVGFAPHPFALAVGARAGASVAASALVVAIG
ncbi:MAG: TOBE domain-containing protein [Hydrogenophaga sp.]|uniref:TOBE domain-containing protein n=1 Tax=Hydrogenophaga sp. TaxID=1904254 RepID=UPI001D2395DE|nr:TOBE domain-containing protein [Hydrogenophaga sp.]MBX3611351.1 TOBE domain-containing protein [Hydrogenophaga sp.]